ncbi:uncharacterized protein LOC143849575 [Tasmannia lanceolata]|uniref:uncharacterized protein LOC143849575 n=1 Tax=Tasmannia lanceolata TaxID=3420 RepID=UPI004063BF59
MGRIKTRQWVLGDNICLKQISKYTVDDCKQEKNTVLGVDSGDDSDDSQLAEAGSEFSMVGAQLSSIPYELYDLPDLKEILSLETWNSCLTEAERFSLSAYLPDMDQHTFWLTMTELLSGKGMFFSSPLTELFERLKGGFYPPKVTRFREGLQFLQKRAFYHSLRSYHESMIWTFSEMKRAWSKCQPSFSVEERMHFWNIWKNHKPPKGWVDLNSFAVDDDLHTRVITGHVAKKMKFPPPVKDTPLAPLRTNGKGVMKIKPAGMNTIQTSIVCRATPKGVLKIVSRGPLGQLQQPRAMTGDGNRSPLLAHHACRHVDCFLCHSPCIDGMQRITLKNLHFYTRQLEIEKLTKIQSCPNVLP